MAERKRTVAQQKAKNARTAERRARKAAATARGAGAIGPRLPASKAVLGDAAIVSMAWAGVSTKRIASEFDVSEQSVRSVLRDFRAMPSGLEQSPTEILEELMRWHRSAVADFVRLAAKYENVNAPAAIGAKRQARETMADYVTLLASIGKLPTNLGTLRVEAELRKLGDEVLMQLEQVDAGKVTASAARRTVGEMIAREASEARL